MPDYFGVSCYVCSKCKLPLDVSYRGMCVICYDEWQESQDQKSKEGKEE